MEAVSFHAPTPELFDSDDYDQMLLFLYQVKFYLAVKGMEEQLPEREKVFTAIAYLHGYAFECVMRYLGDFLTNKEGHREKGTSEIFGSFLVFKDWLRLLFRKTRLDKRKITRKTYLLRDRCISKDIADLRRHLWCAKRRQQRLRNN
jgi:hypothetical protein